MPAPPVELIEPITDDEVWAVTLKGMEDAVYTVLVDAPHVRPPVVMEWLANRPEYGEAVDNDGHLVVHGRSTEDRERAMELRARRRAEGDSSRAMTFVRRLLGHRDV